MSKGVLGLGCSYTWGEGLYYYSDLENLPFEEYHSFDPKKVTSSMIFYKDKYKFTELVSNYLNTWSWTNRGNGGSIKSIVDVYARQQFFHEDAFNISDFKLMIFQFTEAWRDNHILDNSGFADINKIILDQIEMVDNLCLDFEKEGVKVVTFSWFDEFPEHPLYQEKFKNRHIDITVDGITKPSYDFFLRHDEFNMTIKSDFEKKGYQKNDLHFNKRAHRIIADLIIDKLKKDNFTL